MSASLDAMPLARSGSGFELDSDLDPLPHELTPVIDAYDADGLVGLVFARCSQENFADYLEDEDFAARLRASIAQNVYALREVMIGRLSLDEVELDDVLSLPSVQARLRIPQKAMQRSYRLSFHIQWDEWTRHVCRHIDAVDLPRAEALDLLGRLTRLVNNYHDFVASRVADVYTRDYDELNRSRTHVRHNLVREVLRNEEHPLSASDLAVLAYSLDAHHIAILLPEMPETTATRLSNRLRTTASAHQVLVHPETLTSSIVWLGRIEPWREDSLREVVALLCQLGITAAISGRGSGIEGFRLCRVQARDAEQIRRAWTAEEAPIAIRYDDVDLEVLLLQNTALARTFVETELGALAEEGVEAARLRATLEASFHLGSHVAAAKQLELHEHTVRNRLAKAERLLGHSLQERRTELQVALRLLRLLD
jgi:DNA-binding PucR family transcriptional regulator